MNESTKLMRTFPAAPGEQVILANMQKGPFNRWAFRNMRRMLPTGNVWRGEGRHEHCSTRRCGSMISSSRTPRGP